MKGRCQEKKIGNARDFLFKFKLVKEAGQRSVETLNSGHINHFPPRDVAVIFWNLQIDRSVPL